MKIGNLREKKSLPSPQQIKEFLLKILNQQIVSIESIKGLNFHEKIDLFPSVYK